MVLQVNVSPTTSVCRTQFVRGERAVILRHLIFLWCDGRREISLCLSRCSGRQRCAGGWVGGVANSSSLSWKASMGDGRSGLICEWPQSFASRYFFRNFRLPTSESFQWIGEGEPRRRIITAAATRRWAWKLIPNIFKSLSLQFFSTYRWFLPGA